MPATQVLTVGSSKISGVLPVDKPSGWTSHDVVARIRHVANQRQVGHAGTLDPLATGLLVLVLGQATRLVPYLTDTEKVYRAEIVLGATTPTDDAEADPTPQADASGLTRDQIERGLLQFRGEIDQVPPAYAAVRRNGERSYVLARKGIAVETLPRQVIIHGIDVEEWSPPRLCVTVRCGPGTYIRSLARDLGAALHVGGYLLSLRRLASGRLRVRDASPLDHLRDLERLHAAVLPADTAVLDLPCSVLEDNQARAVRHGQAVRLLDAPRGMLRLYDRGGRFIALAECEDGQVKPRRVFGADE